VYKSKAIVEIEVSHHGTSNPLQTVSTLLSLLAVPAVNSVVVKEVETNYQLHAEPAKNMVKIQVVPADQDFKVNGAIYMAHFHF
jgi:hypothetical protein